MDSFDNGEIVVPANYEDKILTGELVKLWPWARGYYKRDLLYFLWKMMEEERMTDTIFYAKTSSKDDTPVSTHMDLIDFIAYFAGSERLLLIPTSLATGEIIGFSWYDGAVLGEYALGSMFYRKKFWGEVAKEATQLALRYGFEICGFKKVWGHSPWMASVKHRARVGFTEMAELPDAVVDRTGKSRTMYIGVCLKENFYGQR